MNEPSYQDTHEHINYLTNHIIQCGKAWAEYEAEALVGFWEVFKAANWSEGESTGEEIVHSWFAYRTAICSRIKRSRSHIDNQVKRIEKLQQDGVPMENIKRIIVEAPMSVDDLYDGGKPAGINVASTVEELLAQPGPEDARALVGVLKGKSWFKVDNVGPFEPEINGHRVAITYFKADGTMTTHRMVWCWESPDDISGSVLNWLKAQLKFKEKEDV